MFQAMKRARFGIVTVALAYVVSVLVGMAMVHSGNRFALGYRDRIVGKAMQSKPSALALQRGNKTTGALLDFTGNLFLGAVPQTISGLGIVPPYYFALFRGWVGGIVSVSDDHRSRLANPPERANSITCVLMPDRDPQPLLDYCREWVHPDIQFSRAPELPPEMDHAARAAGGVHFLRECSHEELGWRKKAFIEDLQCSRKNGDFGGLLTGGELRKLLRKVASPAALLPNDARPTAAVATERRNLESEGDTLAGIAPPSREITRIDIERRQAELQRQAEIILQKYPKLGNTTGIPSELLPVKVST
jgi:hypothetical protein